MRRWVNNSFSMTRSINFFVRVGGQVAPPTINCRDEQECRFQCFWSFHVIFLSFLFFNKKIKGSGPPHYNCRDEPECLFLAFFFFPRPFYMIFLSFLFCNQKIKGKHLDEKSHLHKESNRNSTHSHSQFIKMFYCEPWKKIIEKVINWCKIWK